MGSGCKLLGWGFTHFPADFDHGVKRFRVNCRIKGSEFGLLKFSMTTQRLHSRSFLGLILRIPIRVDLNPTLSP